MIRSVKIATGVGLFATLAVVGVAALLKNTPAHAGDATASRPASEQVVEQVATVSDVVVTVYRSPTCGCCKAWEDHLREAGYTVESIETAAVSEVKAEHNVPRPLQSCHTALVEGYVIEGHVPAADIARLLSERPDIRGLAVPGMPAGSPGMEVPGRAAQPYEVYAFTDGGSAEVWAVR